MGASRNRLTIGTIGSAWSQDAHTRLVSVDFKGT